MPRCSRRSIVIAGLVVAFAVVLAASVSLAQSGKPEYQPEVEAVARTIFLELLSPY